MFNVIHQSTSRPLQDEGLCPHWHADLQIMYSLVEWLHSQMSLMCSFSLWAISCSRSPTGRSCKNKYWGCEVTLWKMGRHSFYQRFHEGNGNNWRSGCKICWTEWYEIPSCLAHLIVNLLVLSWIDTLKALILQVCLTNQGFSGLSMELYYVYLTKLSRSLIVVRATLRQSVCLWTW